MNSEEQTIIDRIATRIAQGRRDYGAMDVALDGRDFVAECQDELLDGLVYLEMVRRQVEGILPPPLGEADTAPAAQIEPAVRWLTGCIGMARARGMVDAVVIGALQWVLANEEKRRHVKGKERPLAMDR